MFITAKKYRKTTNVTIDFLYGFVIQLIQMLVSLAFYICLWTLQIVYILYSKEQT